MTWEFVRSFENRALIQEQMDDLTVDGLLLNAALLDLRRVNRLLGGYRTLLLALQPLLKRRAGRTLSVLDLGAGAADYAEQIVLWASRYDIDTRVVAIDANPAVVRFANSDLNRRMPPALRARIEVRQDDALDLTYADDSFDVVTASHFLHHLTEAQCVRLLREMARLASEGIIVNDLRRHPIAYVGFRAVSTALRFSSMTRHDGLLSVRRGFRSGELSKLARSAGFTSVEIGRRWAYRLCLSTLCL